MNVLRVGLGERSRGATSCNTEQVNRVLLANNGWDADLLVGKRCGVMMVVVVTNERRLVAGSVEMIGNAEMDKGKAKGRGAGGGGARVDRFRSGRRVQPTREPERGSAGT